MSKESKETTVSVGLEYMGLDFTLSVVVSNYELEERLELLAKQVKVLAANSGGLPDPE